MHTRNLCRLFVLLLVLAGCAGQRDPGPPLVAIDARFDSPDGPKALVLEEPTAGECVGTFREARSLLAGFFTADSLGLDGVERLPKAPANLARAFDIYRGIRYAADGSLRDDVHPRIREAALIGMITTRIIAGDEAEARALCTRGQGESPLKKDMNDGLLQLTAPRIYYTDRIPSIYRRIERKYYQEPTRIAMTVSLPHLVPSPPVTVGQTRLRLVAPSWIIKQRMDETGIGEPFSVAANGHLRMITEIGGPLCAELEPVAWNDILPLEIDLDGSRWRKRYMRMSPEERRLADHSRRHHVPVEATSGRLEVPVLIGLEITELGTYAQVRKELRLESILDGEFRKILGRVEADHTDKQSRTKYVLLSLDRAAAMAPGAKKLRIIGLIDTSDDGPNANGESRLYDKLDIPFAIVERQIPCVRMRDIGERLFPPSALRGPPSTTFGLNEPKREQPVVIGDVRIFPVPDLEPGVPMLLSEPVPLPVLTETRKRIRKDLIIIIDR